MKSNTDLGKRLLEVIPPLMHQIRIEVRASAKKELTIPQFRILAHIQLGVKHVSQIAELHGVSQPSMSKMVEGLVKRGLIKRAPHSSDRRQIVLELTGKGKALYEKVKIAAQKNLNVNLINLSTNERTKLSQALDLIAKTFKNQQDRNKDQS